MSKPFYLVAFNTTISYAPLKASSVKATPIIFPKREPMSRILRSFRLVCEEPLIPLVELLLQAEGYVFSPEPFSPWCRALHEEPRPLGSSLAAIFGLIYIQDRSSMLPPLALLDEATRNSETFSQNPVILDMCASPGSKTGFLGQLAGRHSFVLGNEPAKPRLATLRANMQSLSLLHVGTCSYGGETVPLRPASFDFIQLDPPCSGWGTVEKNPNVLKLWQGDKVKPLIGLQQLLLQKAWELLRPGGQVVYSTCTTNVQENEDQVRFAVEELGFEVVPITPFAGFVWEDSAHAYGEGTLGVDGERSQAQGFYIAKFRKPLSAEMPNEDESDQCPTFQLTDSLNISALEAPCTDISLLAEGHIGLFGDMARFIPRMTTEILPAALQWQAAPLGKVTGNTIRLGSRCRALLPLVPPTEALILDSLQTLRALLQGQSLQTGLEGRETGLYLDMQGKALPLGRITLKKGRALWSAK